MSDRVRVEESGALVAEALVADLAERLYGKKMCYGALDRRAPETVIWHRLRMAEGDVSVGFERDRLSVEQIVAMLEWLQSRRAKLEEEMERPPHCHSIRSGADGKPLIWVGLDHTDRIASTDARTRRSVDDLPHRLKMTASCGGPLPLVRAVGDLFVVEGHATRELTVTWEDNDMERDMIDRCEAPFTVELGEVLLTIGQLSRLRPGDILQLALRRPHPVRLSLDGVPILRGSLAFDEDTIDITIDDLIVAQHSRATSDSSFDSKASGAASSAASPNRSQTEKGEKL